MVKTCQDRFNRLPCESRKPQAQPLTTSRCSHTIPEDRVFRSEQLGSSNQYMKNPSVEQLQRSTKTPFPRTTSSVALRPLLTTPEVSFVDTILSSYHQFQTQWTAVCRLSSQGAGPCARVLQTRTHQVDMVTGNKSPSEPVAPICSNNRSLLIKKFGNGGHRTIYLNLHGIFLFRIINKTCRDSDLCVNRRRFRVPEMTSCSSVA